MYDEKQEIRVLITASDKKILKCLKKQEGIDSDSGAFLYALRQYEEKPDLYKLWETVETVVLTGVTHELIAVNEAVEIRGPWVVETHARDRLRETGMHSREKVLCLKHSSRTPRGHGGGMGGPGGL